MLSEGSSTFGKMEIIFLTCIIVMNRGIFSEQALGIIFRNETMFSKCKSVIDIYICYTQIEKTGAGIRA